LSQAGAKYAGEHGVGYREILSFYYPYTTLKQIEMTVDGEDYHRKVIEEIKVRVENALKELEGML
jgi:hypothetical protein